MSTKKMTTPDFGGSDDVTVIEILVKPGDRIEVDAPVITLESDKATMELPATDAGIVKEIAVKVGDKVSTGSPLLLVETSDNAGKENAASASSEQKESESSSESQAAKTKPAKNQKKSSAKTSETKSERKSDDHEEPAREVLTGTLQTDSDIHAGPGVRRMARELGVNLSAVEGSGPKQRIIKEDIDQYVKSKLSQLAAGNMNMNLPAAPSIDFAKFGAIDTQPLSRIKKISGKNLQRNWMLIPHVTQFGSADITSLEHFRQEQKAQLDKQQIRLTPLVFIMKAVVASLKAFPHFNASLDASGENLVVKKYFHLGVAVDTPDGLVVPVVRDVNKKGLIDLAVELAEVSQKARKKQLLPKDMQGGTFSISSLGGIGGSAFTPIINAPEVAILGISKSSYQPVYQDGVFEPRLMLPLSLSYDHRVIDGADGARFMTHLIHMLSDIRNLLL